MGAWGQRLSLQRNDTHPGTSIYLRLGWQRRREINETESSRSAESETMATGETAWLAPVTNPVPSPSEAHQFPS